MSSSDGETNLFCRGWKAAGISDALEKGLAGFSGEFMDPFNDIDPFVQGEIRFNITSVVSAASEEYVENEIVTVAHDDDDDDGGEYLPDVVIADEEENGEDEEEEEHDLVL